MEVVLAGGVGRDGFPVEWREEVVLADGVGRGGFGWWSGKRWLSGGVERGSGLGWWSGDRWFSGGEGEEDVGWLVNGGVYVGEGVSITVYVGYCR